MKSIDLKELTLDNLAIWPLPIKISVVAICCLLILVLGYWFDISTQFTLLEKAKENEATLRIEFQTKMAEAGNVMLYQKQLQEAQQVLAGMINQLPNSTEIPNLLEEISKLGIANGLQFNLFKPMPEDDLGFFIELPIQIAVIGSYHQLGSFISQVAGLNRIVTLQDFTIDRYKGKADPNQKEATIEPADDRLIMNITAETYRYSEETSANKKADDKNINDKKK